MPGYVLILIGVALGWFVLPMIIGMITGGGKKA